MQIPKEVIKVVKTLKENGYKAYLVGGCVRDFLSGIRPKDWDISTDAYPRQIQGLFPKTFYDNKFFTVKVITGSKDPILKEIEITTYRAESNYEDRRHPKKIEFADTIEEDLKRRDFTVNAMALDISESQHLSLSQLVDPFQGKKDLENKIIRTVGNPFQRFSEDALRLMRAVRFATVLNHSQEKAEKTKNGSNQDKEDIKRTWEIEKETFKAVKENKEWLVNISKERIRDELIKILESPKAQPGVLLLHKSGLLKYIIPELEEGAGVSQNRHHIYTILQHAVLSLKYAALYNYSLEVRVAALFHDIAKPHTKQGEGPESTFYNHDIVGAKITRKALNRLRFPKKFTEKVSTLVKNHMFYYDPEEVSESSVRRLLRKVGKENIDELIQLRICDRKGSGVPKAKPYRLRHLEYVISKVSRQPISTEMLNIDGNRIMEILEIKPGPRVGLILNALLNEVLENPNKNYKKYLEKRVKELGEFSNQELEKLAKKAEEKKIEIDRKEKRKFHVH